ncbi:hypothetical protein MMC16_002158 [Acarospora aff. strigata]|nr:hypothetical protein [Acarospora aff. strigata]
MSPSTALGSSATPTQTTMLAQGRSMSHQGPETKTDKEGLHPPQRYGRDGRSHSNSSVVLGSRGASIASAAVPPGSFSSDLKSTVVSRGAIPRSDLSGFYAGGDADTNSRTTSEQRQADFRERINKEIKIKTGTENMLEALISKNAKQTKEQRLRVESELNSSNRKIAELKLELEDEVQRSRIPTEPSRSRLSSLFRGSPLRSPSRAEVSPTTERQGAEVETESPTYVLAEILQALELEAMQPDYYVERANSLVELFKRHPTLKYDLAWSVFGLRVQMMLLSDSREVVAAGYRVTRYAIADRKSLQIIRELHTDDLVVLSLVKESKASIEREQALKFVRAFLDVKDGVREVSRAVVRTIVSVAEHYEDRLRSMCNLTLAEIMIKDPYLLVSAGGIGALTDALAEGTYHGSESLASAFLYLLDTPFRRQCLASGREVDSVFAPFTDSLAGHGHEEKLKSNAKVIAAMLKTWPGLITLSMHGFKPIRSFLSALSSASVAANNLILETILDVLHIKPPSWSSSYLAGRRLTTYGRVAHLKSRVLTERSKVHYDDERQFNLLQHYTALVLAVLVESGLVKARFQDSFLHISGADGSQALANLMEETTDFALKRKAALLLGEVMKLANQLLPDTMSAELHVLPHTLSAAIRLDSEQQTVATGMVYQVDSINRNLYKSARTQSGQTKVADGEQRDPPRVSEQANTTLNVQMDEAQFRTLVLDTQVLNTVNFMKWRWDLIHEIVEGPLLNPKRLDEAIKATKFVKRLIGFYRPFKYRFSDIKNTKPNQRYVRTGCALMRTLLQNPEGVRYLAENKLLRQIAECLAQLDRMSGLTSTSPLFSPSRVSETLTGGYFALLGTLSADPNGLIMIERWRMINMFYHIIELKDRDDLVQMLLGNMDFSLDSHLRVMLSKALTGCQKDIRISATRLLRKYAIGDVHHGDQSQNSMCSAEWAIRLLITQLYDPEVEVCEVAVKILEEACNQLHHLEYVVKCRPALDHLGEIGAPLLLRFLSTSIGYHYLDGLDYITQEMDDWFLGRNDNYATLVEASLARASMEQADQSRHDVAVGLGFRENGVAPPHFYRELTRTAEGCKLLKDSGHFLDFVSTIESSWAEKDDHEVMLKVKGCLWAVGNVGSMELGASFLEETDVIQWIVKMAESSEVLTLRGTAFFVLGLISRSLHGLELLNEYGWDTKTTMLGQSLGLCIPQSLHNFFSTDPWKSVTGPAMEQSANAASKSAASDDDPINAKILTLVVDLGNTVLTKKAASDLHGIKAKKPEGFREPQLFHKVMRLLERHHYRLLVRRFVIDLFDKHLMRRIVLEDDSESDSDQNSHPVQSSALDT